MVSCQPFFHSFHQKSNKNKYQDRRKDRQENAHHEDVESTSHPGHFVAETTPQEVQILDEMILNFASFSDRLIYEFVKIFRFHLEKVAKKERTDPTASFGATLHFVKSRGLEHQGRDVDRGKTGRRQNRKRNKKVLLDDVIRVADHMWNEEGDHDRIQGKKDIGFVVSDVGELHIVALRRPNDVDGIFRQLLLLLLEFLL